jgi:ribonuclease D
VKGALELVPVGRAILRELCLARETEAQRRDVPPFKVIGNEALLAIARRRPHTRHDLRNVGGDVAVRHTDFAEQLLEGIRRGEAVGDVPAEDLRAGQPRPLSGAERNAIRAREKALQTWRRATAAARAVDAQVVLPGHCLAQLAEHDADSVEALAAVRGIGAMRVARDADELLALLRVVRAQPAAPEAIALSASPSEPPKVEDES